MPEAPAEAPAADVVEEEDAEDEAAELEDADAEDDADDDAEDDASDDEDEDAGAVEGAVIAVVGAVVVGPVVELGAHAAKAIMSNTAAKTYNQRWECIFLLLQNTPVPNTVDTSNRLTEPQRTERLWSRNSRPVQMIL